MTNQIGLGLTLLSLIIWAGLLGWRGQFWRSDQKLESLQPEPTVEARYPAICAIIPARNEADFLPTTLRSLLAQDYPGRLTVIVVDDHSTDGTAAIAQELAQPQLDPLRSLSVVSSESLPSGWTGKLWAMNCGIQQAQALEHSPDYFLLTDADIAHDRSNLSSLVAKAQRDRCDLVSLMVQLRCQSLWERLLVPAFVFFFQKLYPFRWVNDRDRSTAAAAGGCILIRQSALTRIGGIQSVRHALIDDCALAEKTKSSALEGNKIWLGLSETTHSLRAYPSLSSLWNMVARTAFTQLNHSIWLLLGTIFGMILIYILPPMSMITGLLTQDWLLAAIGAIGWSLMAWSYLPILRLYRCPPMLALSLPITACLYTLMTLDSAMQHWQGRGGAWKGRVYPAIMTDR